MFLGIQMSVINEPEPEPEPETENRCDALLKKKS